MKIGAVYPQTEMNGDPAVLDAIGRAVEAIGYDHLLIYDHVAGAVHEGRVPPLTGPYDEKTPFHDPLVSLAYLAAATQRIGLATGVVILPQRQTLLVARQAADVDLLSGGRLRLGVGSGWNPVEYEGLGQDFHTRGERLSEQIPYLRRLWSEPVVDFKGKFDRLDRAGLVPRPKRVIPIWCGGFSEPAFRRAAKLADGFIFFEPVSNPLDGLAKVKRFLGEEGRASEDFGADLVLQSRRPGGAGESDADRVKRWQDAGGTHASVITLGLGFTSADQHIDHLAEVRAQLGSA